MRNRIWNVKNPYQGDAKKVLCVCSAGLLRSPTAAIVLANEFGYNTRAAGVDADHALIPVDDVLLEWADETVCMDSYQASRLYEWGAKNIIVLSIPDMYAYMDPELVEAIKKNYAEAKDEYYGFVKSS